MDIEHSSFQCFSIVKKFEIYLLRELRIKLLVSTFELNGKKILRTPWWIIHQGVLKSYDNHLADQLRRTILNELFLLHVLKRFHLG